MHHYSRITSDLLLYKMKMKRSSQPAASSSEPTKTSRNRNQNQFIETRKKNEPLPIKNKIKKSHETTLISATGTKSFPLAMI